MRLLLLVNATASSVTPRAKVVIQKALSADHDVTAAETSRRGHGARLAQGAAADGFDVVVVLGGDGTLNEAANGLAGTSTALGVLPGGSTNVFARTIGMTDDPIEATGQLLSALARGSIRPFGLGAVNGRYFLFHAGVGFDAAVIAQVERRGALKRYLAHPLFIASALSTWSRHYDRSRPHLSVQFPSEAPGSDGGVDRGVDDGYFLLCLNTNPYTYLGNRPLDVAPDATFDRGLVAVTVRSLALPRMLGIITSALVGSGTHLRRHRLVDYRTDLGELVVHGYGPLPWQVDGDHVGTSEVLHLRHEPEVLQLVLP